MSENSNLNQKCQGIVIKMLSKDEKRSLENLCDSINKPHKQVEHILEINHGCYGHTVCPHLLTYGFKYFCTNPNVINNYIDENP